jgi:hypothetical protein
VGEDVVGLDGFALLEWFVADVANGCGFTDSAGATFIVAAIKEFLFGLTVWGRWWGGAPPTVFACAGLV